ncbi:hypothetical protein ACLBYG_22355 [Methylobacterium sp. D53M]
MSEAETTDPTEIADDAQVIDPAPEPAPDAPVGSAPEAAPSEEPASDEAEPAEPLKPADAPAPEPRSSEPPAPDDTAATPPSDAREPAPEGFVEVEHEDLSAAVVVSGATYVADAAGRFFVRAEHLAAVLAHGFRPLATEPATD